MLSTSLDAYRNFPIPVYFRTFHQDEFRPCREIPVEDDVLIFWSFQSINSTWHTTSDWSGRSM